MRISGEALLSSGWPRTVRKSCEQDFINLETFSVSRPCGSRSGPQGLHEDLHPGTGLFDIVHTGSK